MIVNYSLLVSSTFVVDYVETSPSSRVSSAMDDPPLISAATVPWSHGKAAHGGKVPCFA